MWRSDLNEGGGISGGKVASRPQCCARPQGAAHLPAAGCRAPGRRPFPSPHAPRQSSGPAPSRTPAESLWSHCRGSCRLGWSRYTWTTHTHIQTHGSGMRLQNTHFYNEDAVLTALGTCFLPWSRPGWTSPGPTAWRSCTELKQVQLTAESPKLCSTCAHHKIIGQIKISLQVQCLNWLFMVWFAITSNKQLQKNKGGKKTTSHYYDLKSIHK